MLESKAHLLAARARIALSGETDEVESSERHSFAAAQPQGEMSQLSPEAASGHTTRPVMVAPSMAQTPVTGQ
jgi:hypothetical protein